MEWHCSLPEPNVRQSIALRLSGLADVQALGAFRPTISIAARVGAERAPSVELRHLI
jgi:hypothetical protein